MSEIPAQSLTETTLLDLRVKEYDLNRLLVLKGYFEKYLSRFPPKFSDEGQEKYITGLAWEHFINLQIWFPQQKGADYDDLIMLGDLGTMFHNVDIPGAAEFAIQKYNGACKKNPKNYLAFLKLARFYAHMGLGWGKKARENAFMALKLDKRAKEEDMYIIAAMGYYYEGKPRESYKMIQRQLEFSPQDENAKAFKEMLETFRGPDGKIPESVKFRKVGTFDYREQISK